MTDAVSKVVNRLVLSVLTLTAVMGCGVGYEPGSFTDYGRASEPRMRSLDCLDVRMQPRGEGAVGRRWVAIDYEIGNRCTTPVDVTFRSIAVFGEAGTGMTPMELYDPRSEVIVATLDGHAWATEALAYEQPGANEEDLERVCVDVTGMAEGAPVDPVCFRRDGATMTVEVAR